MRSIFIDLSSDRQDALHRFGGFEGEHNETKLTVRLPERMTEAEDGEYRFIFETAKGEVIFSAPMQAEDGCLSVMLVKSLTIAPELCVSVGCYRYENGETVQISKSGRILLGIKNAEEGEILPWDSDGGDAPGLVVEDSVLPDSPNPVQSRGIYEALSEKVPFSELKAYCSKAEAEEFLRHLGERYASAIRSLTVGKAVRFDDASANSQELKIFTAGGKRIALYGRNLFDGRMQSSAKRSEKGDVVSAAGYATTERLIPLTEGISYTVSFEGDFSLESVMFAKEDESVLHWVTPSLKKEKAYSFTAPTGARYLGLNFVTDSSELAPNSVQLELGKEATAYELYREPVTVTADEKGQVSGLFALLPTTTVVSPDGEFLAVEYSKDTDKAYWDLREKYSTLQTAQSAMERDMAAFSEQMKDWEMQAENQFANALKGEKRGEGVSLKDVSAVCHFITAAVYPSGALLPSGSVLRYTKNYIPSAHKYQAGEKTELVGITFTDHGDDTVTANGKNSGDSTSNFYVFDGDLSEPIPAGEYLLFGCGSDGKEYNSDRPFFVRLYLWDEEGNKTYVECNREARRATFTLARPAVRLQLGIRVMQGVEVTNQRFYTYLFRREEETAYRADFVSAEPVPSAWPETYLLAEKEGSEVRANYNRDLNRAFLALEQAVLKGKVAE